MFIHSGTKALSLGGQVLVDRGFEYVPTVPSVGGLSPYRYLGPPLNTPDTSPTPKCPPSCQCWAHRAVATPPAPSAASSGGGYWYVATPYSKYAEGLDAAFRLACRVSARLLRCGVKVFSPIAHTHPIAMEGGMDPLDHTIWLPADEPLMAAAKGLIVVMADGWRTSYGMAEEIKAFHQEDKPVVFVGPDFRQHELPRVLVV